MELADHNPSQIESMLANQAMNILDINRKRKLAAEQLSLPTSKHQCWNGSLPSRSPIFSGNLKADIFATCSTEGKLKRCTSDQGPETGSSKDSHSFAGDPDSSMSEQTVKYEVGGIKVLQCSTPSCSFSDSGTSSQDSTYSSNAMTVTAKHVEPANNEGDLKAAENFDEALLEFDPQCHGDYLYSGYGSYNIEQCPDKDIEETFCSNGANPYVYALSSGRWGVNQEAQQTTRNPTIDQEFEEYFSSLLL